MSGKNNNFFNFPTSTSLLNHFDIYLIEKIEKDNILMYPFLIKFQTTAYNF